MSQEPIAATRVLIVDDDPDFRSALTHSFRRLGYQVTTAENGREAFEKVTSDPVDVVISDIRMPGGDGIEFLERAKGCNPRTPIILLVTGYAEVTTEQALDLGAEALFGKPFDSRTLHHLISQLLEPPSERWARSREKSLPGLDIQLRFESLDQAISARVLNLGRGGAFIALPPEDLPSVHDHLSFVIRFESGQSEIQGEGVVRWVRTKPFDDAPAGIGIEFLSLSEESRRRVVEFLEVPPRPFIPRI